MFLARVYVVLKPTVSDPQGKTIAAGLRQMDFTAVRSVRAGKYMEIRLDGESEEEAGRTVDEMCGKLLVNPVIEEYHYDLERVSEP